MTPDAHPIVGEVADGLYAACGFSGHGFMQAPAVGRIVADELLGHGSRLRPRPVPPRAVRGGRGVPGDGDPVAARPSCGLLTRDAGGATFVLVADGTRTAQREIRLALVLNGGVSLAIWIGGVVAEIDRARRAGLDTNDARGRGGRDLPRAPRAHGQPPSHGRHRGRERGRTQRMPARERDRERRRGRRRARTRGSSSARSRRCSAPVCESEPESLLKGDEYFLPEVEAELTRRLDVAKGEARHRPRAMRSRSCAARRAVRHRHEPDGAAGPVPRRLRRHPGRPRAPRALLVPSRARGAQPRRSRSPARRGGSHGSLARPASFPGAFEASFCRVGRRRRLGASPRSRASRRSSATHG